MKGNTDAQDQVATAEEGIQAKSSAAKRRIQVQPPLSGRPEKTLGPRNHTARPQGQSSSNTNDARALRKSRAPKPVPHRAGPSFKGRIRACLRSKPVGELIVLAAFLVPLWMLSPNMAYGATTGYFFRYLRHV